MPILLESLYCCQDQVKYSIVKRRHERGEEREKVVRRGKEEQRESMEEVGKSTKD